MGKEYDLLRLKRDHALVQEAIRGEGVQGQGHGQGQDPGQGQGHTQSRALNENPTLDRVLVLDLHESLPPEAHADRRQPVLSGQLLVVRVTLDRAPGLSHSQDQLRGQNHVLDRGQEAVLPPQRKGVEKTGDDEDL